MMDFVIGWCLKIGFIVLAVGGVWATRQLFHTKDDNIAEEVVEKVIENQTGFNIDLTPQTPEPEESESIKTSAGYIQDVADVVTDSLKKSLDK